MVSEEAKLGGSKGVQRCNRCVLLRRVSEPHRPVLSRVDAGTESPSARNPPREPRHEAVVMAFCVDTGESVRDSSRGQQSGRTAVTTTCWLNPNTSIDVRLLD